MNGICTAAFVLPALLLQTLIGGGAVASQTLLPGQVGCVRQSSRADWLVKPDVARYSTELSLLPLGRPVGARGFGSPLLLQANLGESLTSGQAAPELSGRRGTEVHALEFGGAALGTAVAAIGPLYMIDKAYSSEDWAGLGVLAIPTYAVSSTLLSTTGTHLVGKAFRQGGSFGHAFAGGALGGLIGSAALYCYQLSPSLGTRFVLVPLSVILPPLCAVVVYNVWRNDDSN